MELEEVLRVLARYWMARAQKADAQPVDYRLAGLICKFRREDVDPSLGWTDPDKWFDADRKIREHLRNVAGVARVHNWIVEEFVAYIQLEPYDPLVFDEELRGHLFATVYSAADTLRLGLSKEQTDALASYVVTEFEHLLGFREKSIGNTFKLSLKPLYSVRQVDEQLGRKENIVEFLRRVYANEIAAGTIADADLSSLDRSAYNALHNWNAVHQDDPFHLAKTAKVLDQEFNERLAAVAHATASAHVTREQLKQIRKLEASIKPSPN